MPAVLHGAAAQALGWALIHFLWEGAAVAALLAAIMYLGRPVSAKARYAAACIALAAMLAAFGVTLAVLWPAQPVTITPPPATRFAVPAASLPISPLPPAPPDRLSWIVPLWMAGVLIFYARTAGGWLAAQRLRGKAATPAAPEWQERLRALAARLRVTRPVVLLESCLAESPVMMGFLRPVILVPAGLLAGLAPDQLEAILLHELAHIRRHDYAVNVMQSLVEGLLFYHPAVWWISGIVRAERENCCDDAVVAVRGDARGYAAALAALESLRSAGQPALAAKGGNLMRRIHRLLEPERPRSAAAPVLAAILLLLPLAWALAAWPPAPTPGPQGRSTATAPIGAAALRERTVPNPVRTAAAPPAGILLAQAAPPNTQERPASGADAEYRDFLLFYPAPVALSGPYRKWLEEDVAYIITDEERQAFRKFQTNDEREQFIEQFWLRRDPTPGTIENEFKEEHYRRIAYANEHFAAGIPGWRTDRGRIYIVYGPPDELEDHSHGSLNAPPSQRWRYRLFRIYDSATNAVNSYQNVVIVFEDPTRSGEYRIAPGPVGKAAPGSQPPFTLNTIRGRVTCRVQAASAGSNGAVADVMLTCDNPPAEPGAGGAATVPLAIGVEVGPRVDPKFPPHPVTISVPVRPTGNFKINIRMPMPASGRPPVSARYETTIANESRGVYRRPMGAFPAGAYRVEVELTDLATNKVTRGAKDFRVADEPAAAPAQAAQNSRPESDREAEVRILTSQYQANYGQAGQPAPQPAQAAKNQKLANLDAAIRQQQMEFAALIEKYQSDWPAVKEAQAQLNVLQAERDAQAAREQALQNDKEREAQILAGVDQSTSRQAAQATTPPSQPVVRRFIIGGQKARSEQTFAAEPAPDPRGRTQVEYAQSQAGKQVAAPAHASDPAASAPPAIYHEVNPAKPPSDSSRIVTIYIPLKASSKLNIFGRITASTRRRVSVFEDTVSGLGGDVYGMVVPLAPGTYTLDVVMKDLTTNEATTTTQEIRVDGAR
jgi:GWxTD domain-containing protein